MSSAFLMRASTYSCLSSVGKSSIASIRAVSLWSTMRSYLPALVLGVSAGSHGSSQVSVKSNCGLSYSLSSTRPEESWADAGAAEPRSTPVRSNAAVATRIVAAIFVRMRDLTGIASSVGRRLGSLGVRETRSQAKVGRCRWSNRWPDSAEAAIQSRSRGDHRASRLPVIIDDDYSTGVPTDDRNVVDSFLLRVGHHDMYRVRLVDT